MTGADLALGIGSWIASFLFNAQLAYLIYLRLRRDRITLNAVIYSVILTFVTSLVVLVMGQLGLLTRDALGILSILGLGVFLLIPTLRSSMRESRGSIREVGSSLRVAWLELPTWARWFAVLFLVGGSIRFILLILLLPPFVWDSLTYHLTNVAHWVQTGRVELFATPMTRIYTPANYELLAAWFTVFLHHDALVEAAGLPAYLLALISLYGLLRRIGVGRAGSILGALSYGSMPALLIATTGTKNDPHMAAYFIAALFLTITIVDDRLERGDGLIRSSVALFILLLMAFGTKAYLLHLLPGIVLLGFVLLIRRGGLDEIGRFVVALRKGLLATSRTQRVLLGCLFIGGLYLGLFWNARNWVLQGNPFYPYGVAVEGEQLIEGAERTAMISVSRLGGNLALLIERFGDHLEPIRPDLPYVTGWGWLVYSLGLPTAAWALFRSRWFRILFLAFAVSFTMLLVSIRPSPWNLRYVIWFPAVFSVSLALWLDRLRSAPAWLRVNSSGLFVALVGLNFATTLNYNRVDPDEFGYMLERSIWSRSSTNLRLTVPAEYENAEVFIPDGEAIGYSVGSNGFIYPLYGPDFEHELIYLPFRSDESCQTIGEKMGEAGVRYLFVAPGHSSDQNIAKLRECAAEANPIRERARGVYVLKEP